MKRIMKYGLVFVLVLIVTSLLSEFVFGFRGLDIAQRFLAAGIGTATLGFLEGWK